MPHRGIHPTMSVNRVARRIAAEWLRLEVRPGKRRVLFKATEERNVCCYDLCPFGAQQEVAAKIGGAKPKQLRWSSFLLWAKRLLTPAAISLALIYRNPGLSIYEIFGTAFALEGGNSRFALLAIILLSSPFRDRPWCRRR